MLLTHTWFQDWVLPKLVGRPVSCSALGLKNSLSLQWRGPRLTTINLKCSRRAVTGYFVIPNSQPLWIKVVFSLTSQWLVQWITREINKQCGRGEERDYGESCQHPPPLWLVRGLKTGCREAVGTPLSPGNAEMPESRTNSLAVLDVCNFSFSFVCLICCLMCFVNLWQLFFEEANNLILIFLKDSILNLQ